MNYSALFGKFKIRGKRKVRKAEANSSGTTALLTH
jgi:hypothetical protein